MTTGEAFAQALESLRRDMLRFARLQLRNDSIAEDAVQEAFIAAYEKRDSFGGRSSLKTWVFTILRNKIIDMIRAHNSGIQFVEVDHTDAFFDDTGHWTEESWPAEWGNPEQSLEQQQFWAVFDACLYRLNEAPARAFMLREMMGFDMAEICKTLGITKTNCGVLLYRARLALRACLENTWFAIPA
ncbi:MAG TPA: sigma-70 family RNA polymerase sigma factor [Rhodocyclaceae bacterium]|jgi:RNA polymerase sigma-70 factor (ECF subfamily)|nr:sigma-70 family RNA polymerase sigma factor [Rhodocyclaceae bacterium]